MWSVKEVLLKMMKRNYILFAIVALISVAMFPVSAFATGNVGTASTSFSTEFNFDFDTEQSFTEEQWTEILNNGLGGNLNVGELTEIGITEDGSVLYATLVEESEISYANTSKIPFVNAQVQAYNSTTSRTVIFQLNPKLPSKNIPTKDQQAQMLQECFCAFLLEDTRFAFH
jgi:hypothetical protein